MGHRRLRSSLVSPLALLFAAGFALAADHTVTVTDNPAQQFDPRFLTIQAGDSVTWKNVAGSHNVEADDLSFTSGGVTSAPWTYSHTFPTVGEFPYNCSLHASDGQRGTIVVRPARAATEVTYTVNSWDMERLAGDSAADTFELASEFARTEGSFLSSVHLPSGAKLTGIEISACHEPANTNFAFAHLMVCPEPMQTCTQIASVSTTPSLSRPCRVFVTNLPDGAVIDNLSNTYGLDVEILDQTFRSVKIYYKRGLSPAPATATFGDVPTGHQFFRVIEAFSASGITQGCGNGNFCPNDLVTRGAMASFFSRAMGLFWPN